MNEIVNLYSNFSVSPLGYATVRDYCDSFDNLRDLATGCMDLKDVQRPWIVKAILGSVRPGGRLLEIGAARYDEFPMRKVVSLHVAVPTPGPRSVEPSADAVALQRPPT